MSSASLKKTLLNIVEGKNSFCKLLRKAKNPLIIVGSEFVLRKDSNVIQNLLRMLSKKNLLLLNTKFNLNFVHANITQTHFSELALNSNAKSSVYNINKNNKFFFIDNNINEYLIQNNANYCSLNTHRFEYDNKYKYLLPINSFYERNSLNINVEGVVQKAYKVKTPLNLSRNSEDIFRAIFSLNLEKNLHKNVQIFTKK